MSENGEEKLLAVARHIAKTLGHNNTHMADDILQIFSSFDNRFSRQNLSADHTNNPPPPHDNAAAALDHTLHSLHRHLSPLLSSPLPLWSDASSSSSLLHLIDDLLSTLSQWSPLSHDPLIRASLLRADDLLQHSMFRLQDEFRSLIHLPNGNANADFTRNSSFDSADDDAVSFNGDDDADDDEEENIPVAQPVVDYDVVIDVLPSATVNDLHEIAKRMVVGGFGRECSHVYGNCRREFLEESFSRLGLQKLSIEDVHKMQWQDLEDEIERWIKASNVSLRILFPSERRLCDRVFFGFSAASDHSFMEVCRGATIQLLNFADAVAIGSRSPERLFRVLDVFEALRDLIPEFESLFSDQYCLSLRNEALTIWKRLGEAIRGIFMELENLIRRDPAKAAVPGGGLHPITRYVMNYLRAACRSRQTLEQVFEEDGMMPMKDFSKLDDLGSHLSVRMAWIMELLESNLEAKSKIYRDSALCSVFMMNNGRYIVQKAKDSELGTLLGDDWIRKHTAKVKQYHGNYQRSSWNKVLNLLKVDSGSLGGPNNAASKTMKEKLRLFNTQFEEICRVQSTWFVFDELLREEIRISLEKVLMPAYGNFLSRFRSLPDVGNKQADKYIKYVVEDIEAKLNGLFQGGSASMGRR